MDTFLISILFSVFIISTPLLTNVKTETVVSLA